MWTTADAGDSPRSHAHVLRLLSQTWTVIQARSQSARNYLEERSRICHAPMAHTDCPLQFPSFYNPTNSVHIDDLGRNFALKYVHQFPKA